MRRDDYRRPLDKKVSFGFLVNLTAVGFYLTFLIARPFLVPIIAATLLAVAIQPIFTHLLRYVRNRSTAAFFGTAAVLLALLLPAVIFVNTLASETNVLYGWLDQRSSGAEGWSEYLYRLADGPLGWLEAKTG